MSRDAIPKCLHILDLLFDRQIIEARRRHLQRARHDDNLTRLAAQRLDDVADTRGGRKRPRWRQPAARRDPLGRAVLAGTDPAASVPRPALVRSGWVSLWRRSRPCGAGLWAILVGFAWPEISAIAAARSAVGLTSLPFSGVVPSVSEDHVRCNGGLGSAPGRSTSKRLRAVRGSAPSGAVNDAESQLTLVDSHVAVLTDLRRCAIGFDVGFLWSARFSVDQVTLWLVIQYALRGDPTSDVVLSEPPTAMVTTWMETGLLRPKPNVTL